MWLFKSKIGLMKIYVDTNNKFALNIDNTVYGYYSSAVAAADDVYTHTTGCNEWDSLDGLIPDSPADIYEWEIC